jgi:uncharacterized protein (TIGR03663 family)
MSAFVSRWLPLALVALAALCLRTHELARRPMHADEANQAVKTGELLEHGRYAFDPHDHHGPTLYYFAVPVAWVRGQTTLAALDETTVRLVPVIFGTLGVLLLFAVAVPFTGPWTALGAAALMAVAPASVYYSRYFIQETLLVTFTLGLLACGQRWWKTGRLGWAVAAGACYGLMQATKASAPLFAVAALAALLVVRRTRPAAPKLGSALAVAAGTALLVAALFYSSFGTHWSGLRDAVATYTHTSARAAGGSGHEKSWWYYLNLFGWHREGGLLWQQLAFSVLALSGVVVAFAQKVAFLRWAALYTAIVVVALSVAPYKTPWHAVHLVPGLALLAAGALAAMPARYLGVAVAVCVIALQFKQTNLSSYQRPADARNPYAYVHTSSDILKVRPLADAAMARTPSGVIRVISEEYWPLPWYLRGLPQVGYWATPPEDCDGPLVLASATQAAEVRKRLHGEYRETYLGLRPGFLCVAFTPVTTP